MPASSGPLAMHPSHARHQRHRQFAARRARRGSNTVRAVALAVPLFVFASLLVAGLAGAPSRSPATAHYAKDLPDPRQALEAIKFTRQTKVWDRTGKVLLAVFGTDRREPVTYEDIPPELIDATTSIEDKTFWENTGFDPVGFVSAAMDTLEGRPAAAPRSPSSLSGPGSCPTSTSAATRPPTREGPRDHPGDPPDRAYPGHRRQARDHGGLPQQQQLREPLLRRARPPRGPTGTRTSRTSRSPSTRCWRPSRSRPTSSTSSGMPSRRRTPTRSGKEQVRLVVPQTSAVVRRRNHGPRGR